MAIHLWRLVDSPLQHLFAFDQKWYIFTVLVSIVQWVKKSISCFFLIRPPVYITQITDLFVNGGGGGQIQNPALRFRRRHGGGGREARERTQPQHCRRERAGDAAEARTCEVQLQERAMFAPDRALTTKVEVRREGGRQQTPSSITMSSCHGEKVGRSVTQIQGLYKRNPVRACM